MRPNIWVPVAMFVVGVSLIAAAVITGEADVTLFLVFPVFSGSSAVFMLGTLFIVLSFFVGFFMLALGQAEAQRMAFGPDRQAAVKHEPRTEYGGVVLVGPFPIAFGSDRKMAVVMLVVGIVIAIIVLGLLVMLL